jgi:hypothetical protein
MTKTFEQKRAKSTRLHNTPRVLTLNEQKKLKAKLTKPTKKLNSLCDLVLFPRTSILEEMSFGSCDSLFNVSPKSVHVVVASISYDPTTKNNMTSEKAFEHLQVAMKSCAEYLPSTFTMKVKSPKYMNRSSKNSKKGDLLTCKVNSSTKSQKDLKTWLAQLMTKLKKFNLTVVSKWSTPFITVTKFSEISDFSKRLEMEKNWESYKPIVEWNDFQLTVTSVVAYLPWKKEMNNLETGGSTSVEERRSKFVYQLNEVKRVNMLNSEEFSEFEGEDCLEYGDDGDDEDFGDDDFEDELI